MKASFKWIQKNKIAGSAKPRTKEDIDWLYKQGIRAVVSLDRLCDDLLLGLNQLQIEHLFLPIEDSSVPTEEQVAKFLQFTEQQGIKSKPVLVHCDAGLGRTGTMLAIYLVNQGTDAEQAIETVGTLENVPQKEFVLQYGNSYTVKRKMPRKTGK